MIVNHVILVYESMSLEGKLGACEKNINTNVWNFLNYKQ